MLFINFPLSPCPEKRFAICNFAIFSFPVLSPQISANYFCSSEILLYICSLIVQTMYNQQKRKAK